MTYNCFPCWYLDSVTKHAGTLSWIPGVSDTNSSNLCRQFTFGRVPGEQNEESRISG